MISAAYSSERQSCLKANVVIDFIANYARRKEFFEVCHAERWRRIGLKSPKKQSPVNHALLWRADMMNGARYETCEGL